MWTVNQEFDTFQSILAKLLYVAIRARLDMLLPVAFLCTRVTKSTKQDQMKLKHVLEYDKGSIDLVYTMGAESLNKVQSWVDAAYEFHPDIKSPGGFMGKSTKQKLSTKSSTEAELIGASDYLRNTIWLKLFMETQGHKMDEIVFEKTMRVLFKWKQMGKCLLDKSQDNTTSDIFGLRIKPRRWRLMSDIVQLCQCRLISLPNH